MNIYTGLIALGVFAIGLAAFFPFLISNPAVSFISIVFAASLSILMTYILTRKWMEEHYTEKLTKLKKESDRRIRNLKREHDTTTLEKTIRDGTQTLIKNALDYFKIENIKNEIGTSAAIENLQLDKYGQIIELLADFSLILPDINENKKIVEDEITHQIKIYRIDENPFALFLERIMKKYSVTVEKKLREKIDQELSESMKRCPQCAEKVMPKARICKHCGYSFGTLDLNVEKKVISLNPVERGKKNYRSGRYQEALRDFDAAIAQNKEDPQIYYNRAIVYNKMGRLRQAKTDLEEASRLGHEKARELLSLKAEAAESP